MDINFLVPKVQRYSECVDIMDWISKLPDEILAKILNYLPTKQAVANTILSKRWEHLWTLTSDLDFSDGGLYDYCTDENKSDCIIKMRSFQKYMDTVIFCHGGSNIRKCHMSFSTKYAASSVYSWIFAVMTCNVQESSLALSRFLPCFRLPWRLYSCNNLVVLRIRGDCIIDLPTYVCFPCLKLLSIAHVIFVDDVSMERLLSSCPILEELIVDSLKDCLSTMNISVPSLKRLCIRSSKIFDYNWNSMPGVP